MAEKKKIYKTSIVLQVLSEGKIDWDQYKVELKGAGKNHFKPFVLGTEELNIKTLEEECGKQGITIDFFGIQRRFK